MRHLGHFLRSGTILRDNLILTLGSVVVLASTIILLIISTPPPIDFPLSTFELARLLRDKPVGKAAQGLSRTTQPPSDNTHPIKDPSEPIILQALAKQLGVPSERVRFRFRNKTGLSGEPGVQALKQRYHSLVLEDADFYRDDPSFSPLIFGAFTASLQDEDGAWRSVTRQAEITPFSWQLRLALLSVVALCLTIPPVWFYSQRLARPIRRFAAAAHRIGRGSFERLEPVGPREIRVAAAAMNEMQERLERYLRERTAMVGAVAHDLRTPMARLAFIIADAPPPLRAKMERELADVERLIATTIDFVQSETKPHQKDRIDLRLLVEGVIDDQADLGRAAAMAPAPLDEPITIEGDAILLRRLLTNLVENALSYGGSALARVERSESAASVTILDDGPGMTPPDLERAFEPFYRADRSRNSATGGMGLGLAIVAAIARAHAADVTLENRPGGGLSATVVLPVA